MLLNKADQAFSRGLHFWLYNKLLDSESVFILARWLDLLFVCMKIKTCACTRWIFWVTRYEILQEISYSPDILIGDRSTLDKEHRAANNFDLAEQTKLS